jgi:hypothetical protein
VVKTCTKRGRTKGFCFKPFVLEWFEVLLKMIPISRGFNEVYDYLAIRDLKPLLKPYEKEFRSKYGICQVLRMAYLDPATITTPNILIYP